MHVEVVKNKMGCDGMCAMTSLDVPKVKEISIMYGIRGWEAAYTIASNTPIGAKIDKFCFSIRKDINTMLRMKFDVPEL